MLGHKLLVLFINDGFEALCKLNNSYVVWISLLDLVLNPKLLTLVWKWSDLEVSYCHH